MEIDVDEHMKAEEFHRLYEKHQLLQQVQNNPFIAPHKKQEKLIILRYDQNILANRNSNHPFYSPPNVMVDCQKYPHLKDEYDRIVNNPFITRHKKHEKLILLQHKQHVLLNGGDPSNNQCQQLQNINPFFSSNDAPQNLQQAVEYFNQHAANQFASNHMPWYRFESFAARFLPEPTRNLTRVLLIEEGSGSIIWV